MKPAGRNKQRVAISAVFAFGLSGVISGVQAAGLLEVDQRVFGMDCAPCAYGVEQGLKKLHGVKSVTVSLNRGKAVVAFGPDSAVRLDQLRNVIRKNGFTPKDATVRMTGRLVREGGELNLMAGSSGHYRLRVDETTPSVWEALQRLAAGSEVELIGRVPEAEGAVDILYVTGVAARKKADHQG